MDRVQSILNVDVRHINGRERLHLASDLMHNGLHRLRALQRISFNHLKAASRFVSLEHSVDGAKKY